jgi:hypothetical protein
VSSGPRYEIRLRAFRKISSEAEGETIPAIPHTN